MVLADDTVVIDSYNTALYWLREVPQPPIPPVVLADGETVVLQGQDRVIRWYRNGEVVAEYTPG